MAKFQNVTIGFNQLNKMSVPDRFEVASADKSVLTNLTPEQYSRLFPGYYKNILSKGVTEKSVTQATTQGAGRGGTSETPSVASGGRVSGAGRGGTSETPSVASGGRVSGAGRPSSSGAETGRAIAEGRVKSNALQQILKKNGIGSSDPAAMTELQRNQKDVFEKLKKGSISADDASVGFMKEISTEKLKSAGIERVQSKDGKFEYKLSQTSARNLSDEDISKQIKTAPEGTIKSGRKYLSHNQQEAYSTLRSEGVSDEVAKIMVANVSGEALHKPDDRHPDPSRRNPKQMAHGIVQWDDRRAAIIKEKYGKFPNELSTADQTRAYLWEMKTYYPKVWQDLNNKDLKTEKKMYSIVANYEVPADKEGATKNRLLYLHKLNVQDISFGPPTPENIAKKRQEMIRSEEAALVPDFPQGLDQRYKADYAKLDDRQKYALNEYIQKNGVANLNGRASATATSAPIENSPLTGAAKELQGDQATVRRGNIDPRLKGILDGAASATGIEVDVFSGGQMSIAEAKKAGAIQKGNTWYLNGKPVRIGSTRHDDGLAADVKLHVRDSEGKRRQLNPQNPEDEQLYRKFVVETRKRGATGYGAGPGYMSGTDMHVDIARQGYWGTKESAEGAYPWLAPSIAQGDVELKKQRLAQAAEPKVEPKAEPAKISRTPEYLKEKVDVETVEAKPSGPKVEPPPKLQAQASPENPGDIRKLPQTQVAEATPVEVKAEGGPVSVNADEIKALPIQGLKGDNAIVADKNSNPLFTMNTKQESARYDPRTSQVMVEPISQTNPDSLMNPEQTQPQSVSNTQPVEQSSRGTDLTTDIAKAQPNYTVAQGMSLTANPVHCPSFARAIAASNMMKTSDIFGGHFDWGASNLA